MNDEDILSSFSDDPKADKLEAFDKSTTTAILLQAGVGRSRIRQLENELGSAYGSDWLTSTEVVGNTYLFTTRVFSFNMDEMMMKPKKHPITMAFVDKYNEVKDKHENVTMVFKCNGTRMVASTIQPSESQTYLSVAGLDCSMFVCHFADYFKREQPLEV
jgi:hypothetical protein